MIVRNKCSWQSFDLFLNDLIRFMFQHVICGGITKTSCEQYISFEESLVCFEIDVLPDLYCWRWTTVVNCIMFYIQCTCTMYAANQPTVHWTCERATSIVTGYDTVLAYENEIIMRWLEQKPPQIFTASIPLKLTHFN